MNKVFYSLILALILSHLPYKEIIPQTGQDFYTILNETRKLKIEKQNLEACDVYESISNTQLFIQNEDVNRQEEFLYEKAQHFLDVADKLTNINQRRTFARKSHDYWKEYIDWYDALTDSSKSVLNQANERILKATAFFGNSIILYDPKSILDEYKNSIPNDKYFGPDAVDLWWRWLYRYPDLREVDNRARVRREKICNENYQDYWIVFSDFLTEWVDSFANLKQRVKNDYLREVKRIQQIKENCN